LLTYDSDEDNKKRKLKEIEMRAKQLTAKGTSSQFGSALDASAREVQIIFCTRTHSQISQIVNESKKTDFSDKVSIVPIISRKGLCVHEKIKDSPSVSLLNERCQELCEKSGCPYNEQQLTEIMSDRILVRFLILDLSGATLGH
jgi:hypothetical protein